MAYRHAWLWFGLALVLAVYAFWPSYFARLRETSWLIHAHGITALAWLLMLVVQAGLYRSRRLIWHRRVGRLSLLLAPAFVVSGILLTQAMLTGDTPFHRAFATRLAFVDLTTVIWFAVAYALAIRHRRRLPLHARYMASTALLVLPPALTRAAFSVPGITSFEAAAYAGYVAALAATSLLVVNDLRTAGRASIAYVSVLILFVLHLVAFNTIHLLPWWSSLVQWLARVPA